MYLTTDNKRIATHPQQEILALLGDLRNTAKTLLIQCKDPYFLDFILYQKKQRPDFSKSRLALAALTNFIQKQTILPSLGSYTKFPALQKNHSLRQYLQQFWSLAAMAAESVEAGYNTLRTPDMIHNPERQEK